jgi:hypothetical protein
VKHCTYIIVHCFVSKEYFWAGWSFGVFEGLEA